MWFVGIILVQNLSNRTIIIPKYVMEKYIIYYIIYNINLYFSSVLWVILILTRLMRNGNSKECECQYVTI